MRYDMFSISTQILFPNSLFSPSDWKFPFAKFGNLQQFHMCRYCFKEKDWNILRQILQYSKYLESGNQGIYNLSKQNSPWQNFQIPCALFCHFPCFLYAVCKIQYDTLQVPWAILSVHYDMLQFAWPVLNMI